MFRNLNAEMARNGITGEYLAGKLGITQTTLSLKLNGKSELSLKQAAEIKSILGVDLPLEVLFATMYLMMYPTMYLSGKNNHHSLWKNGEGVFRWWTGEGKTNDPNQMTFDEFL